MSIGLTGHGGERWLVS